MSAARSVESWKDQAHGLSYRSQCFIGNRYVSAKRFSGKTFDAVNPATGRALAQVAACDPTTSTSPCCPGRVRTGAWSRMAPVERKKILLALPS